MAAIKNLQLFGNCLLGFGVKQIIDSLSFLFLLKNIWLNFNLKSAWIIGLIMKISIYRFFSKNWNILWYEQNFKIDLRSVCNFFKRDPFFQKIAETQAIEKNYTKNEKGEKEDTKKHCQQGNWSDKQLFPPNESEVFVLKSIGSNTGFSLYSGDRTSNWYRGNSLCKAIFDEFNCTLLI